MVGPVSPIPAREPEEKKTGVQVNVEWPSRTKVNNLHEGLESFGKMLCHGTYKQIARSVWKNLILKCYYDEILMSYLSQRIIYTSSLRKTVN